MRITFYRSSPGFAYLPGLAQHNVLDTEQLPPVAVQQIKQLLQAAHFFELPAQVPSGRAMRDAMHFTITVEDSDQQHAVEVNEPTASPALKALFAYLNGVPR